MELGSYQIIRKLATGGMAEIFLARHKSTEGFQRNLVIKRILPEYSDDPAFVQSFLDEAKLAGQLNHPNIVQIYDLGRLGKSYFIAMEYIRGFDISTLLRFCRKEDTFLPVQVAVRIFCDVCAGLDYAHGAKDVDGNSLGVVHRDVTPSNVIVSMDGPAKVVDFGIAKATAKGDGKTKTGTIKGKFAYLAPEQVLGQPIDKRADVFASGIMLYELLTNTNPFRGETEYQSLQNIVTGTVPKIVASRPDVPEGFDAIIEKALARDVNQRYSTCGELLTAVEELAHRAGVSLTHADVHAYLGAHETTLAEIEARARGGGDSDMTSGSVIATGNTLQDGDAEVGPQTMFEVEAAPRSRWPMLLLGSALLVALVVVGVVLVRANRVVVPESVLPEETALEVSTDPVGAQVLVDGVLVTGVTPLKILSVEVGHSYKLDIVKTGFRPGKTEVKIEKPGMRNVQIALADVTKALPIKPEGKTEPRFAKKGLDRGDKDKDKDKSEKPPPGPSEPGRLRVTVVPWGSVTIDGQKVGDTPFAPRELSAGEHVVLIENADLGKKVTRRVRVPSGSETTLREDLSKD